MAGAVLSTTPSGSHGLLSPGSRGVVFAFAFCIVLKEEGLLSIKLALDVIGGFCSLSLVLIGGMGRPERGDRKWWWMKKLN